MRIFTFNKKKLAAMGAVIAVGGGTVAYAYWTTSGSGSGTAAAGTSSAITVAGTSASTLYPATSSTVSFTAANPGTGNQSISTIHLVSVQAYPTATDRTNGTNVITGCGGVAGAGHDFAMPDVTVNPATDGNIVHGATAQGLVATGTLTMNDLTTNQDACKLAYLALTLTSS
jgi:hypothetical protein